MGTEQLGARPMCCRRDKSSKVECLSETSSSEPGKPQLELRFRSLHHFTGCSLDYSSQHEETLLGWKEEFGSGGGLKPPSDPFVGSIKSCQAGQGWIRSVSTAPNTEVKILFPAGLQNHPQQGKPCSAWLLTLCWAPSHRCCSLLQPMDAAPGAVCSRKSLHLLPECKQK